MKAERRVEAAEVSGTHRRVACGILRDRPDPPEPEALRPLARALVDLAVALTADEENDEREAS